MILPASTDFAAAACLGIPAMTAFQAIRLLGDIAGKTVLVIGASSSVGHYAAQLAVMNGATVFGTVGSAEKAGHALAAGVEVAINYKTDQSHSASRNSLPGAAWTQSWIWISRPRPTCSAMVDWRRTARWFPLAPMPRATFRFRFERCLELVDAALLSCL